MDKATFSAAVAAIASGTYDDADIKSVKTELSDLSKQEAILKREIEKDRLEFSKKKDKSESQLKNLRSSIKSIKRILSKI